MTAYEILDLRLSMMNRFNARQSFWLTATFAVFGAVHVKGGEFDIFSQILLVVFYFSVTLLAWTGCRQTFLRIEAATEDIRAVAEEAGQGLSLIKIENQSAYGNSIWIIQSFLFVGGFASFILYLVANSIS